MSSSRLHPVTDRPFDWDHVCASCRHVVGTTKELRACKNGSGRWPLGEVSTSYPACELWQPKGTR